MYLHGAKRHAAHAFARGVQGHAPPRNFLQMVRFREYFVKILSKK